MDTQLNNLDINNCDVFAKLPSTNSYLLEKIKNTNFQNGYVVIADTQEAGRGQREKGWLSGAANITFSVYWGFNLQKSNPNALSLAVGVILANTIKEYTKCDIKLKWPNDLYVSDKKLGGILVETKLKPNATLAAVIGVGINFVLPELPSELKSKVTALSGIKNFNLSRQQLLEQLILGLRQGLQIFEEQGFLYFHNKWIDFDYLKGKNIIALEQDKEIQGLCSGVDVEGNLLLKNSKNDIQSLATATIKSWG